jgi:hypothetical protein
MDLYPDLEVTTEGARSFAFISLVTVECSLFLSIHILILEIAIWETQMKEKIREESKVGVLLINWIFRFSIKLVVNSD